MLRSIDFLFVSLSVDLFTFVNLFGYEDFFINIWNVVQNVIGNGSRSVENNEWNYLYNEKQMTRMKG